MTPSTIFARSLCSSGSPPPPPPPGGPPPRHDDHGRAALIDRGQGVLDGDALVKNGVGIVDLAATRASEIAAKQRLQHQHKRIAFAARKMLSNDIGADSYNLSEGYAHERS